MQIKLDDQQLQAAKDFIHRRDRIGLTLASATVAFENTKAHCIQQIELENMKEQKYMADIARAGGIDPNKSYSLDYDTGILKQDE